MYYNIPYNSPESQSMPITAPAGVEGLGAIAFDSRRKMAYVASSVDPGIWIIDLVNIAAPWQKSNASVSSSVRLLLY